MSTDVQLSIGLPNFGTWPQGDWRGFIDVARAAEDAGVDRVVLVDHVVMGPHTDKYVWGRFPTPPEAAWPEPLSLLSAIAAVTERIRLATGILIAPLRGATLLAKTAATIDQISGGRLELGVATGWQREEYDAAGLAWDRRGQLLTDTLAACKALWTQTPAAFESPTVGFTDTYCEPKPVQPGGVPLWIGGSLNKRNLARIVDSGDGWIPIMGLSTQDMARDVETVRAALADAGRDPAALRVQGPVPMVKGDDGRFDLARTIDNVPEVVAAGATAVHLPIQAFCAEPKEAPEFFAEARRLLDAVLAR
ncbi:TIGR03619 family F420-dependent LLM class oxidoreductase [Yinghuangia seranimata]|uniref:TIGR03619 family F420-dependent LLM class oxidoreductase n=1 Tax=Yinghuangia seranimata TaxID=408067 RepID=UPI00248ADB93|nr:TIGR03619 family F420-dependent LLM class oxidoreductase [Yinghuangia seranimata]MDI2127973.1 TIGR03619 family F420-dependent LLM class oxidoreductase [Yinghuangia seranimata]